MLLLIHDLLTGGFMVLSVNFTLHTEPNVSPPEFTVTCCTEGGPATTVYWDCVGGLIITSSSEHTTELCCVWNRLRVRGRESGIRESGTYPCDITNDAGAVQRGNITVQVFALCLSCPLLKQFMV